MPEMYTYEITLVEAAGSITINEVTEIKAENGVYFLLREDLVLFTAPIESVFYIKSL